MWSNINRSIFLWVDKGMRTHGIVFAFFASAFLSRIVFAFMCLFCRMSVRHSICILTVLWCFLCFCTPVWAQGHSETVVEVTDYASDAAMFVPAAEPLPVSELGMEQPESVDAYEETADGLDILEAGQVAISLPNPTYELEYIRIAGNYQHSKDKILKLMELEEGAELTLEQLEEARVKLMISGLFHAVELHIYPGTERQKLELELLVDERSPFQVNQYFIGTSQKTPFWLGLDVSWLAPFASSHRFRMAFVATTVNDYSLNLGYMVPSIRHFPISLMFSVQSSQGHEEFFSLREPGVDEIHGAKPLGDMDYEKHGGSLGVGYSFKPELRMMVRLEYMHLLRHRDADVWGDTLDRYLRSGRSHLTTALANITYDTRKGRILPNSGHMLSFSIKGTAKTAASQYAFIKMNVAHQSNWQVASQHVLRLNTFAGFLYGSAPFFEKFFYHDFYSLGTSRVLGLNLSSRSAYDLLGTGSSDLGYEDYLVHLAFSYAWQPLERQIELFVTAGATWADSLEQEAVHFGIRSESERGVFPVDLSLNAGARFKTDYGIFSLTIGHVLDLAAR